MCPLSDSAYFHVNFCQFPEKLRKSRTIFWGIHVNFLTIFLRFVRNTDSSTLSLIHRLSISLLKKEGFERIPKIEKMVEKFENSILCIYIFHIFSICSKNKEAELKCFACNILEFTNVYFCSSKNFLKYHHFWVIVNNHKWLYIYVGQFIYEWNTIHTE